MTENCFQLKIFMHSTLMCQSLIWWFTLVNVTVSSQILTCYNWLAYNWMRCLLQSDLFTRQSQFCWSWSLIMHLKRPRKQYKVFLKTHSAICWSYCRVLQRVAAFPTIPAIITDAVCLLGAALFILCVNWRLISSLSAFLSVSHWHPLPRCPLSRRPGGHEYSVIKTVSLPAVRRRSGQGLPRKQPPPTPTHTRAHPSTEHLGPVSGVHPQDPSGQSGDLRVHSGRAPGAQACLRAHLCGVGSHGAPWQEPRCQEPHARCPKQWEPALIGKTRQDRAWQRSQRRTNFHSPSPLFGQTFAGVRSGVPRECTFTRSPSNTGWQCWESKRKALLIKPEADK